MRARVPVTNIAVFEGIECTCIPALVTLQQQQY